MKNLRIYYSFILSNLLLLFICHNTITLTHLRIEVKFTHRSEIYEKNFKHNNRLTYIAASVFILTTEIERKILVSRSWTT